MLGASAKFLVVLQERQAAPGEFTLHLHHFSKPNVWWWVLIRYSCLHFCWSNTLELFVAKTHHLTTLHTILSTGSPLKPQLFDFVYSDIKSDVLLGSITGGTDIIACFAGNNVSLPVFRGEIQSLHLGCAIQSWSEDGMIRACTHFLDEPGLADCPINFLLPRVSKVRVLLWRTKTFHILLTTILCLQSVSPLSRSLHCQSLIQSILSLHSNHLSLPFLITLLVLTVLWAVCVSVL